MTPKDMPDQTHWIAEITAAAQKLPNYQDKTLRFANLSHAAVDEKAVQNLNAPPAVGASHLLVKAAAETLLARCS